MKHVAFLAVPIGEGRRPSDVAAAPPRDARPGEALGRPGAALQPAAFVVHVLHDEQVLGVGGDGFAAFITPAVRMAGHGQELSVAVLLNVAARLIPPDIREDGAVRFDPQALDILLHPGRFAAKAVADPRHTILKVLARGCAGTTRPSTDANHEAQCVTTEPARYRSIHDGFLPDSCSIAIHRGRVQRPQANCRPEQSDRSTAFVRKMCEENRLLIFALKMSH